MRIFVYEFVTGGGLPAEASPPPSLLREGAAMATALAADFAALPDTAVVVLGASRWKEWNGLSFPGCDVVDVVDVDAEWLAFRRLAAEADQTVVIAPEFDGILLERCRQVVSAGGRLLGPDAALIELASDKHNTAEHLRVHGVAAPQGIALAAGERPHSVGVSRYPAVWKRRDGAGSQDVRLLRDEIEAAQAAPLSVPSHLERYCPGLPASVAWLCGPAGCHPLPPCRQWLSDDGRFAYLGGATPLPPPLAARAVELSRRAVGCLPQPRGYLGIDLVLGDDVDGSGDAVIEINPRPTTSYVGLRAASRANLAQALIDAANGQPPKLDFAPGVVEFTADGTVRRR